LRDDDSASGRAGLTASIRLVGVDHEELAGPSSNDFVEGRGEK
jgi:hypothetical protein